MGGEQPYVSIIIPTYNRPVRLAACLDSLTRMDYPRSNFKVFVVDDGSESPPEAVVKSFHNRLNVTLITQSHSGPAAARNTGAARAKGDLLAFTDDDCEPAVNWLQILAAQFDKTPDCAIGGHTVNALSNNPYSAASQLLIDYLYACSNANPHDAGFFTTNNVAFPASRFLATGGFDTTYSRAAAEDREFCDRWKKLAYGMIYVPDAIVLHSHDLTFHTFLRQQFNYGRGAFHFHRKRSASGQQPVKPEPLAFYVNLLCYPFSSSPGLRIPLLMILFLASQMAITAGYLWERAK